MNLEDFHFIRPEWLLLFAPLAILFGFLLHRKLAKGNWESVCDDRLLPYLLLDTPLKRNRWPLFCIGLSGFLTVLALAGPTWEQLPSPVFRNESALVIVLDLSASMDAQDIKPSRLERARFKIRDVLNRRLDGQTALVVYAGDAFTVTPLTDDTETIGNHLSALETSLMPILGSRADRGLEQAKQLIKQAGLRSGNILLITDAVNWEKTADTARQLESEGYFVSVLGVGTEAGAPIPGRQGGFLKDSSGNIVIPRMLGSELVRLARIGGGTFHVITADNRDIEAISEIINQRPDDTKQQEHDMRIAQWDEKGPWLLLLVLPMAALAFRKGIIGVALLTLYSPFQNAYALNWEDLWTTKDQQANRAYQAGEPTTAAKLFENRKWKGVAQYETGEFENAVETMEGLEDSDSLYNKGNALAKLGRYRMALEAYDRVLEKDSNHQDALYNKKLIEDRLKQPKQHSQNSPSKDSSEQQGGDETSQSGDSGDSNRNNEQQESSSQNDKDSSADQNETDPSDTLTNQEHGESEPDQYSDKTDMPQENQQTGSETKDPLKNQGVQTDQDQEQQTADNSDRLQRHQPDESQQATEQWLRRIPDDPGRLLREKFRYQYSRRQRGNSGETETW